MDHQEYRQAAMTVRSRVLDVVRKSAALHPLPLLRSVLSGLFSDMIPIAV